MSPTRKPPTADKGAPEPKPSRKVAIAEVLRSLQDLVSNELSVEPARPAPAPSPPEESPAPPIEIVAAPVPAPEPEPGAAPAVEAPMPSPEDFAEAEAITLEALPEPESATPPAAVPPEGLQQELPYLDAQPAPPVTMDTEPASELLVEPEAPRAELPATEALTLAPDTPSEATPAPSGDAEAIQPPPGLAIIEPSAEAPHEPTAEILTPAEEGDLGDIPVLEDAIDLSELLEPAAAGSGPLPAAVDARRLAIQTAARLNVALRKEGQPGLSSHAIARLAHLLEEALAKAGANMENNPPEKH